MNRVEKLTKEELNYLVVLDLLFTIVNVVYNNIN